MDTVRAEYVEGRVEQQDGTHIPVTVRLSYHAGAPLEIHLLVGEIAWEISRDLLVTGLDSPAGLGDVQIWPADDWLSIRLNGNDTGHWEDPAYATVLQLVRKRVRRFVTDTLRDVPAGTERVDVDSLLALLLGGDRS